MQIPPSSDVIEALREGLANDQKDVGPLYARLTIHLRRAIHEGRLRIGASLPPERDLAQGLGVSRQTVRKSIEKLTQEGLLKVQQGSGTFVAGRIVEPLNEASSFSDDMRRRGLTARSILLKQEMDLPNPQEALALNLSLNDRVCRFTRVRLADGEPIAVEFAVVAAELLGFSTDIGESLYAAIRDRGRAPVRAMQRVRAGVATAYVAQALAVPAGSPVLEVERFSYCTEGRPVEWTRSSYRGDRYDYVVEMRVNAD